MYYGQYCSQYYMRTLAYGSFGNTQETCQLLLGDNDTAAAQKAGLSYTPFIGADPQLCMAWIKQQIVAGFPVTIGLYMNESIFEGGAGDPDYDHIVLVTGIQSNYPLTDSTYYPDDVIIFSDHGLYTPDDGNPPFIYSQVCGDFARSRAQANDPSAPAYSLPDTQQYAGVFTGRASSLPLYLRSATNSELPEISGNAQPESLPLVITAYIDNLDAAANYQLTDNTGAMTSIAGVTTWSQLYNVQSGDLAAYTLVEVL